MQVLLIEMINNDIIEVYKEITILIKRADNGNYFLL